MLDTTRYRRPRPTGPCRETCRPCDAQGWARPRAEPAGYRMGPVKTGTMKTGTATAHRCPPSLLCPSVLCPSFPCPSSLASSPPLKHRHTPHVSRDHPGPEDVIISDRHDVAIEDDEIGILARCERAEIVLLESGVRRPQGHPEQRFLPRHLLRGEPPTRRPPM